MRKALLFLVFLSLASPLAVLAYSSPGQPNDNDLVYDYADMISADAKNQLNAKLVQFANEHSNQIAVVTINSLQGDTIENFAEKLFKEWGIGQADKDNGVLLLISKDDRQMRIEVGYGLEGALTDAQSYWIIQSIMRPAFQAEDYAGGINGAVDKIIAATQGEYIPSASKNPLANFKFDLDWIIFLVFILPIWISSILARSKSWWAGGVLGALIGIVLIFIFSWIIGLIAILVLTPLGLLLDYAVSKSYQKHKTAGTRFPWWIGGFGGGKGGFGGGGFGGFGGGGSGGGGSSGSW